MADGAVSGRDQQGLLAPKPPRSGTEVILELGGLQVLLVTNVKDERWEVWMYHPANFEGVRLVTGQKSRKDTLCAASTLLGELAEDVRSRGCLDNGRG